MLYLEDTSGLLQELGAQCQLQEDVHIIGFGADFDRTKIERAVELIGRLNTPCSLLSLIHI